MKNWLVWILAIWLIAYLGFNFLIAGGNIQLIVAAKMMAGLALVWIVGLGSLFYLVRDFIKNLFSYVGLGSSKLVFVLFATSLALIEEAIAISFTNLAPYFGVAIGEAYLTATTNYLDLVLFHSVIVFIPMFICWSFLLSKYSFKPEIVFLLFGISGIIAELILSLNVIYTVFLSGSFWILTYGLMIYLPAYYYEKEGRVNPSVLVYMLAIFLPLLCALPVAVLVKVFHPVSIHFP